MNQLIKMKYYSCNLPGSFAKSGVPVGITFFPCDFFSFGLALGIFAKMSVSSWKRSSSFVTSFF